MAHYMTTSSENKLRVFSPVILFHDHQFVKESTGGLEHVHIPCGDPYYGQLIEAHKRRIQQMLKSNGRFWSDVRDQFESKQITSPIPSLASSPTPPLHPYDEPPSPSASGRRYYHPYRRYPSTATPRRLSSASHHNQHHMMMLPTAAGSVMGGDDVSVSSSSTIPSLPESPPPAISASSATELPRRAKQQPAPLIKRRRGNLPKAVTAILRDWLSRHKKHPYPTEDEKLALARQTNLTLNQISNWFINARRRILQPMLQKEQQDRILGQLHEEEEEDDDEDDEEHSLDAHLYDNVRRGRKRSASSDRYMPASRPRRTGHAATLRRR